MEALESTLRTCLGLPPHPAAPAPASGGRLASMTDLATLELGTSTLVLRRAEAGDIPAIVTLLAADQLGATRDGPEAATAAPHAASRPVTG